MRASGGSAIGLAIAASGNNVYVGGNFDLAGGAPANFIARWDGSSWSSLGTGAANGVGAQVNAIAIASNGDVYAGGNFTTAGGLPAGYVARWNGNSWSSLGTGVNASVAALAFAGSDLYVGGSFGNAGVVSASYVALWNGSTWASLGTAAANGTGSSVSTLLNTPAGLAVGGGFTFVGGLPGSGGVPANSVALWNGSAWSAFGSGANNGTNGQVLSLAQLGGDLYGGGSFTQAGGVAANSIARWNGSSWSSLGTDSRNGVVDATNFAGVVSGLAVISNEVYVGGSFFRAGGQVAGNVARWSKEALLVDGFDSP